jgi:hypothetical protein
MIDGMIPLYIAALYLYCNRTVQYDKVLVYETEPTKTRTDLKVQYCAVLLQ